LFASIRVVTGARWVVLDVGETLVDETRVFRTWAEIFGLPEFTLMAVLGGSISNADKADDWRRFFELIQHPDWQDSRPDFEARYGALRPEDLYPDALRAIEGLKERGYRVGVTANQPARRHEELEALGVRVEAMGMSDAMGVHKPDPAFFARTLELLGSPPPRDVAYVGDRVDNDVRPSAAAGMRAIWVRRGPWGLLHEDHHGIANLVVRSLDELVERIDEAWTD
jgi:FMN hydrolase / 5-amino-6-(5-phospho-D-ribitylamino)uracil phosphatase